MRRRAIRSLGAGAGAGEPRSRRDHTLVTRDSTARLGDESRHFGDVQASAKLIDRSDGTYAITFSAAVSGEYLVFTTLRSTPVRGSPLRLRVCAPAAHWAHIVASGVGLHLGTAGELCAFSLAAHDANGRRVDFGGHGPHD